MGEVDVADVVGGVVVAYLAVGPLAALDTDALPRAHHGGDGDVRVPPVVAGHRLVAHRLGLIDGEHYIWHVSALRSAGWCTGPPAGAGRPPSRARQGAPAGVRRRRPAGGAGPPGCARGGVAAGPLALPGRRDDPRGPAQQRRRVPPPARRA